MRLELKTPVLFLVLAAASTAASCKLVADEAPGSSATPTGYFDVHTESKARHDSVRAPTPTLSAEIADRAVSACPGGLRISAEIEPARLNSARFEDGYWFVEVVGLWRSKESDTPTPPGYGGYATRPPWRGWYYVVGCTNVIHAESAQFRSQTVHTATAAPPTH